MNGRWFPWHPKGRGGVHTPHHESWGVFSDTVAIASKLYTLHELETWYDKVESLKKFWGISDISDVFMTLSMSDFYVILPFFATASVKKIVETLDFHIRYVFW